MNMKKKQVMINYNILDKVLDKITEIIDLKKFNDIKTLIVTDNKLPDDINFKNIVILMTYIIKGGQ